WVPLGRVALLRAIELNAVSVEKNQQAFEAGRLAAHDSALLPKGDARPVERAVVMTMPVTLDRLIAQRVDLLTAYQNPAYAHRYHLAVERLRAVESGIAGGSRLPVTEAVARNLAKLMAYKDEYEVARLHSSPDFLEELRRQFEGEPGKDYTLNFHLAP